MQSTAALTGEAETTAEDRDSVKTGTNGATWRYS
jgi:hypothetical protein